MRVGRKVVFVFVKVMDMGEEVVQLGATLAGGRVGGGEDIVSLSGDGDAMLPGREGAGGELGVER